VWHEWLKTGNFIITSHAKNCSQDTRDWLQAHGAELVAEVPTAWGQPSIATAMRSVFRAAFQLGAQHACLVSQDSIPYVSTQDLVARCRLLQDSSAFTLRHYDKIAQPLRRKYGFFMRPADQFCILSASGFLAIDAVWDNYFDEFASHQSIMAMDEIFIPSLLFIQGQPIENTTLMHALWATGGVRAALASKAFVQQSLPAILSSKKYLFGRKFDESLYLSDLSLQLQDFQVL
jgi:hypothetical protein